MCSWLQWSVCVFKCVLKCRWWWPDSIYYSWRAGWDFFLLCVGCKKTLYALHQAFSALNETICGAEMCVRCSNAIWHMLRLRIEIKNSWWVIMTMSSSSSPLGMNHGISASERIFFRPPSTEMLVQYFEVFFWWWVCVVTTFIILSCLVTISWSVTFFALAQGFIFCEQYCNVFSLQVSQTVLSPWKKKKTWEMPRGEGHFTVTFLFSLV